MLQSEAGYIDARPLTASSAKSTCNARPDHTSGSIASFRPWFGHPEQRIRPFGPFRAMCGRLRVGKSFFHVLQHWSVQPCVRPFNAVHMTAGHNALRGSGPDQQLAFENVLAHVGCPDRWIDRLCFTCCSPSQPSRHAGCPARSGLSRKRDGFLVSLAPGHHGPDHSRDLVGERDSRIHGTDVPVEEPSTASIPDSCKAANILIQGHPRRGRVSGSP